MCTMKDAARRAATACEALGLIVRSSTLRIARNPDAMRRACMSAEESAYAIANAARYTMGTTPLDPTALRFVAARADDLIDACEDLTEAIETLELESA